jgi:hypothetical protein
MKIATTLQFRKAVRKYAEKKGLLIGESWTNKTTADGEFDGHRTVGFWIGHATEKVAAKIEKKLNKKGLTAKTRFTDADSRMPSGSSFRSWSGTYIRGTCVLP